MSGIRISVCIVSYNVRDFLIQALHSIKRACTDITHEILVVDNASVDGTVQNVYFPILPLSPINEIQDFPWRIIWHYEERKVST